MVNSLHVILPNEIIKGIICFIITSYKSIMWVSLAYFQLPIVMDGLKSRKGFFRKKVLRSVNSDCFHFIMFFNGVGTFTMYVQICEKVNWKRTKKITVFLEILFKEYACLLLSLIIQTMKDRSCWKLILVKKGSK